MTVTLADLQTSAARVLRDPGTATWSAAELTDMINEGIQEVSGVYPRDVALIQNITISAAVFSYALPAGIDHIYRIDVYATTTIAPPAGFLYSLPPNNGEGPNSGWETHAGAIFLPPQYLPVAGYTLSLFGYCAYVQLAAATDATDMDTKARLAVMAWVQYDGFKRLLTDRANFQQWQLNSNNTDVTTATMNQMVLFAERAWQTKRNQLRKFRKLS